MNLLKISRFPDFSQRFPDFSLTKFFKVRKCERKNIDTDLNEMTYYSHQKQQLIRLNGFVYHFLVVDIL